MTYPTRPALPTPPQPCPECGTSALYFLDACSEGAIAWYFRCRTCAHVYTTPRDQPDGPHTIVAEGVHVHTH